MAIKKVKLAKKKEESKEGTKQTKEKIKAIFLKEIISTENSDQARDLYNQSRYGIILSGGKVQLSFIETAYLLEKGTIELYSGSNRKIDFDKFVKKASKSEQNFWTRYCVFKNIRNRGYIIKTALKFGADFRVYDRGVKPGEDHAKWVMYAVHEGESFSWYEFSAKNRVAHSTRKNLLIAIVDDEGDVTYYNVNWERP